MKALIAVVALVTWASCAQENRTVTGQATYRERIALPPDAVFEAVLEDVSRADAPATVIGSSRLEKPGQPPFRFSIPYDASNINAGGSYSVRARITVDGNLMFTSDQSHPVLTRGHGSEVAMILMRRADRSAGGALPALGPPRQMRGMFRYMADAALFTECGTGQRWPVAMEGEYKTLEGAYLKMRREPGEEVLAQVEARAETRPHADGGRPVPTLVIERYIGIWPEETCGASGVTPPLEGTDWKLTRLGDKPVIVAEQQREPSLVFQAGQERVTGFGGCNSLSAVYQSRGSEVNISRVIATRKACVQGMETENDVT
jgi:uncharacterized lipoprotein YbaY